MQHNRTEGGAAHACIRNAHHIFDAFLCELFRYRQIARLRHAGRAFGPGVLHHQNVVFFDIELRVINALRQIFQRLKHHRAAGVLHQLGRCCRLLDDCAFRCEVAAQHGDAAAFEDRIIERAHHVLLPRGRCGLDVFAQRVASNRQRIEIQQLAYFTQNHHQAPGLFEIFHVVLAGGLQIHQHRRHTAHFVESVQVDFYSQAPRHRGEMHNRVGRPAHGQQHRQRVLERIRRHDFIGCEFLFGHGHCARAAGFGVTQAVGHHGRGTGAAGQHHAHRFRAQRHGAGGAHHHAGAGGRRKLVVDFADFLFGDFARAILAPEAAAVGTSAEALAFVIAGNHRPGHQHDRRHVGTGGAHQQRGHGFVAAADQHD